MEKTIKGEMKLMAKKVAKMKETDPTQYDQTTKFVDQFLRTIRPLRYLLLMVGQHPFHVGSYKNKPKAFYANWLHPMNIVNLCFFVLTLTTFSAWSVGLFTFFMPTIFKLRPYTINILEEDIRNLGTEITVTKDWEKELIRRSFAQILIVYLWFSYLIVMNIASFFRRKSFLNYLNYWLFSFQTMQMECPKSVWNKLMVEIIAAVGVVLFVTIVASLAETNIMSSLDVITYLCFRPIHYARKNYSDFNIPVEVLENKSDTLIYYLYKIPGLFVFAVSYIGSRGSIVQFICFNRLLSCISKAWNRRLRDGFLQNEEDEALSETAKVRIELRYLLQDHFNIVQLYKMTENIFGGPVIMYYILQTLALIFQLYHMVSVYPDEKVIDERYGVPGKEEYTEQLVKQRLNLKLTEQLHENAVREFYAALGSMLLTAFYIFITTDSANQAYIDGMAGFQVLRRNCYLGTCDTTDERNFVHSMIVSFAPNNPIELSANGYFSIRRDLVPSVMMNVFGYLVAVYTLKPDTTEFWNWGMYAHLCNPVDPLAKAYGLCK